MSNGVSKLAVVALMAVPGGCTSYRTIPAGSIVVVPLDTSRIQVRQRDARRTTAAALGIGAATLIVLLVSCGDFCS